jgi:hypothetical protein
MTVFAWIQSRGQATVALGGLVIVGIVLAITGPGLAHLYSTTVAGCTAHGDCSLAGSAYLQSDQTLRSALKALIVVAPGILGIFLGAPLVAHELESGTFRLAWTQSVTRNRWLLTKLAVVGILTMAAAGLLSLVITWWSSPLDRVSESVFATFDQRGIVPVGYASFAFALGVTAGVLTRKTVPAMAATLVTFVGARVAFTTWIRPHIFSPLHHVYAITAQTFIGYGNSSPGAPDTLIPGPPPIANGWINSVQILDNSGHSLTPQVVQKACPQLSSLGPPVDSSGAHRAVLAHGSADFQACGVKLASRFHELVAYQPSSRYWPLQWSELAIYLAFAVALCGLCVFLVRRRFT